MNTPGTPRANRKRMNRPTVEALEGRALLAQLSPTIWIVNSTGDFGLGSGPAGDLRYCINQANKNTNPAGSLIEFSAQTFSRPKTINLLFAPLKLTNVAAPEQILGPGANRLTIDGPFSGSVFKVAQGVTAVISGVSIEGGSSNGAGGGISSDGTLTLTSSVVQGNSTTAGKRSPSTTGGGGIYNGPDGTLVVASSTIAGNSATIRSDASNPGSGGGILNLGTATIVDSTISGNSVSNGPGGGVASFGPLTMVNDTIAENSTSKNGSGGGVFVLGGFEAINDTIADNQVVGATAVGGGLDLVSNLPAILINTIVAQNGTGTGSGTTESDISALDGALDLNSDHNLIGPGGSGGLVDGTNGNLVGVANPGLELLGKNGGPTETIGLLAGSVAIAAGDPTAVSNPPFPGPPTFDQRGPGYARVVNGTVDIGAYQTQSS